jgi:hypothetical protein
MVSFSARRILRSRQRGAWDALADVAVFIFATEAELEAMDAERVGDHRRGRKPDPELRRRVLGLFGSMQWRIAGFLSGIPFTTLHSAFARWTRLGLWRRLGQRLAFDWRVACGDEALPQDVVVDSPLSLSASGQLSGESSLRSAPTCWTRGIDGGKLIKGIKLNAICDKHSSLLDLELASANTDDRVGAVPMLPRLSELGFQGDLLGDSGYKGMPFAPAALDHDRHASISPGGTRDGQFLPVGVRWVVEPLFRDLRMVDGLGAMWQRGRTALLRWLHLVQIAGTLLVLLTARAEPQTLALIRLGGWRLAANLASGLVKDALAARFRNFEAFRLLPETCRKSVPARDTDPPPIAAAA